MIEGDKSCRTIAPCWWSTTKRSCAKSVSGSSRAEGSTSRPTQMLGGVLPATEKDYGIILLDIKMPNIDGIQFLEPLRKKPDVPVLIITGYPSIPNAAAAMRLGASDYVTRSRPRRSPGPCSGCWPCSGSSRRKPAGGRRRGISAGHKWIGKACFGTKRGSAPMDGSACAGAVLPGFRGAEITGIRLPRIGEVVYQGLPLADVTLANNRAGGPLAGFGRGRGRQ